MLEGGTKAATVANLKFLILDFLREMNVFWLWGFCTVCEMNLPTMFSKLLWIPSSLVMSKNISVVIQVYGVNFKLRRNQFSLHNTFSSELNLYQVTETYMNSLYCTWYYKVISTLFSSCVQTC